MALAAGASGEQRTLLMAMARSWATLANQIDRLSQISQIPAAETTEGRIRSQDR